MMLRHLLIGPFCCEFRDAPAQDAGANIERPLQLSGAFETSTVQRTGGRRARGHEMAELKLTGGQYFGYVTMSHIRNERAGMAGLAFAIIRKL